VIAFEPNPVEAAVFRRTFRRSANVSLQEVALTDYVGHITLFVPRESQMASIVRPPNAGELTKVDARASTLDHELSSERLDRRCLLKLDLQGGELAALRGATAVLGSIGAVVCEVAIDNARGHSDWRPIDALLQAAGFEFVGPLSVLRSPTGAVVQMDALFLAG
jgi:FkbM family methyltransferase